MKPRAPYILSIVCGLALTAVLLTRGLSGSKLAVIESQRASGERVIAGNLSSGDKLEQTIHIPDHPDLNGLHLGIRFATYDRVNLGQATLQLEQGSHTQSHTVISNALIDNEVRYFPFSGFADGQAELSLQVLGGTVEHSPTVWCRYSPNAEPMTLNGFLSDRRIDIEIVYKQANNVSFAKHLGSTGWVFLGLLCFSSLSLVSYTALALTKPTGAQETKATIKRSEPLLRYLAIGLGVGLVVSSTLMLFSKTEPSYFNLNDSFPGNREHAPPISKGVVVTQAVEITPAMADQGFGLGIVLGTFLRDNRAKMELSLEQSGRRETHTFGSKELIDNQTKVFPFFTFDPGPATLTLKGLNGKGSNSPTVWLVTDTQAPFASVAGEATKQKLITYRYTILDRADSLSQRLQKFPASLLFVVSIVVFFILQWIPSKQPDHTTL